MAFYLIGAIGCLAIAGIIATVLVEEYSVMPGLIVSIAVAGILFMLACAWHLFDKGRQYTYVRKGPRSRLVLTDSDSGSSRRSTGTEEES